LCISTKINKGQIEITKEVAVCTKNKKVGSSEVALLSKLNLKPFAYGMNVISCYDQGSILDKQAISISPNDILAKFAEGVRHVAALSLATGIPTELSIPHMIIDSFKNVSAIAQSINFTFKELENLQAQAAPSEAAVKPVAEKAKPKGNLILFNINSL